MPKATRRPSASVTSPPLGAEAALPYRASFDVTGGNGRVHTDTERLERLEALLEAIQQTLDTQFRRMAAMQAELDQLKTQTKQRGE